MQLDEFLERVASEPPREVVRPVLRELVPMDLVRSDGVGISEFLANLAPTGDERISSYRHILGPAAQHEAVRAWQERWPSHTLPADLKSLIMRFNGIHLWADVETGRSYEGLAPIEEWELARTKMYGPEADASLLSDRYFAISYHADSAAFAVLDVTTGRYFLMDAAGPDETSPIGNDVADLLGWLWTSRGEPD